MLNFLSMSGMKVHFHRPLGYFIVILSLSIIFFFISHWNKDIPLQRTKLPIEEFDDENINLVELFEQSYRSIYQAGQAIKAFKQNQTKFDVFRKKNSIGNGTNEPVTFADLLSHSILIDGLKEKFPNLQVISEEKNSVDENQIRWLKKEFSKKKFIRKIPSIPNEKNFMNVPLSSVAVWIDPLDATQEFTENLLNYVMVMLCVTVEKQPTIGILYGPFTNKIVWGWIDVNQSKIERDQNELVQGHQEGVDDIVISRSHAGDAAKLLKTIYQDQRYRIIPAAGSGYKTVQVLEENADFYLHITPIKKWDLCAPDAILRSHSGKMTTLKNQPISYDHHDKNMLIRDGLLATYKRDHQEILKLLSKGNLTQILSSKSRKQ